MIPQLKGQRCACVTFSHNPSLPGAMCNCGHLACFHLQTSETASPGKNKDEIEMVKQRVGLLEQQSDICDGGAMDRVVSRLSNLEEMVDKADAAVRTLGIGPGDRVAIIAGIPFGRAGKTNTIRVLRLE